MGIIKKIKDFFIEEHETIEEPIKTEVKQVIIPAPEESKVETDFDDVTLDIKREESLSNPVFFNDDEFEGLTRSKKNIKSDYKVKVKAEKILFKPTPVISPVYGILDKNYSKEDIQTKPSTSYENTRTGDINIDMIRKKAFGTLEDELESTLTGEFKKEEIVEPNDLFEELSKEPDIFDELESASLDSLNNLEKFEEELQDEREYNGIKGHVDNDDLFNLIDSMYEKRDN